jgi:two-component system, chemotaxis family, protein-glutamate methylesterase/glutaminase
MWTIKRSGGLTIVQDPDEAMFPSMPEDVMQYVDVDYVLPVGEISELLSRWSTTKAEKRPDMTKDEMALLKMEVVIASKGNAFEIGILEKGELTTFACPECKGALVSIKEGEMIRFRCHTGHAFTSSTLLAGITVQVEEKLWEAMQALESTAMLLQNISGHYHSLGFAGASKQFRKKADEVAERAKMIHTTVFTQELMSEDIRFEKEKVKSSVNIRRTK